MVVVAAGVGVRGDVHVVQLQLAIANQAEAIAQVGLTGTDRLHLRPDQLDAGFQGFEDVVLVPGQPVVRQQAIGSSPRCGVFFASTFGHGPIGSPAA